jgi:deoxyhypusine monooxygenase
MTYSGPNIDQLRACLLDTEQPLPKRTHAAFYLRTMGTDEAAGVISIALRDRKNGSLMRHELAYILGQMQFDSVAPVLIDLLSDETEDILVRHEVNESHLLLISLSLCSLRRLLEPLETQNISRYLPDL